MPRSSTTFQKGQSGNPSGRPAPARKTLEALLDQRYTAKHRIETLDKLIALQDNANLQVALDAMKLLMAYTYGKPVERHEITGADGEPVKAYIGVSPDAWDDPSGD